MRLNTIAILLPALSACGLACADAPPLAAFARRPAIENVSLSPDGRYVLYITALNDEPMVVTLDRRDHDRRTVVLRLGRRSDIDFGWCAWANDTRVLCGLRGADISGGIAGPRRGLIAVDANGSNMQSLGSNAPLPTSVPSPYEARFYPPWYRDRIVDLTPDEPDTVLFRLYNAYDEYPSVHELNVYTGRVTTKMRSAMYAPILAFVADARGRVRLGSGYRCCSPRYYYYYRLDGDSAWHPLASYDAFERRDDLTPIQAIEGNRVYALGPSGMRVGLWELDLADQARRRLLSDPNAEVSRAIFAKDRRLLGIVYEKEKPSASYLDPRAQSVVEGANRYLADTFNEIVDLSADERVYLVRSTSDVEAGSYHVLDVSTGAGELEMIGRAYPALEPKDLGRVQPIDYAARDGTKVPGYLSVPAGKEAKGLPVVVMPHDGPAARDSWEFDYLRLFLVSRGYAVLQMNYRGSTGYGWDWLHAGHQDWAGVSYEDIADAARWAGKQEFADSKRMCVLGRGYGGYAALLASMRDASLLRCAISIGAPTDLGELRKDVWTTLQLEQIGSGRKGGKAESAVLDSEDIAVPVLVIHGTHDWQVEVAHAKRLGAVLKRKRKPHELVLIENAEHDFRRENERASLLQAVEKFLATHLGQP
jgi:dienelactone hydrolase